ncbi:MAG TPA: hypothetical protein VGM03_12800 [Phycisphaerae bacterium]|jgi:hypothetical protein
MSQIPSDIAISGAQAGYQAREAARPLDTEKAGQAHAARQEARAIDDAGRNVETTDGDTQVFTDGEGSGSQGRAFSQTDDESPPKNEPQSPSKGISYDPDGHAHVDVEA